MDGNVFRDAGCRDVPAGASVVSTHRWMHPQRTDASESQPPQSPRRCVSPRCRRFPAMWDVGTYRQVRPLFQPTGGCIHTEQMYRNHNRPSPRVGDVFRDAGCRDVPTGASDVSTYRRMRPQRTDASESPPPQFPRRCVFRDAGCRDVPARCVRCFNPPADISTKNGITIVVE